MTYKKVLVDNLSCSRRFHLTYDDDAPRKEKVQLECKYCQAIIFSKKNHPEVTYARDENLISFTNPSKNRIKDCKFVDTYSPKT